MLASKRTASYISFKLLFYSFSSLVYSFDIEALSFLNMMCVYIWFILYFDFGLHFLEIKVFVLTPLNIF